MDDLRPGRHGVLVRPVKVVDTEAKLGRARDLAGFGGVKREMEERALAPGAGGMAAADPPVVGVVLRQAQVDAECVAIQSDGPVEVGDFKDDGDGAGVLIHNGWDSTCSRACGGCTCDHTPGAAGSCACATIPGRGP